MSTPLLENILAQPEALAAVARYQLGEGQAALERAARLLRSKKRIVLSGMGASLFAAIPFQYALAEHGLQVMAVETAELLYFLPSLIDEDTAVVLVSRSGESVEVIKLLPRLRECGAAVIGVVNVPGSTLSAEADQALVIGSPPDQLVAIQTYTGTVAMFALLGAVLFGEEAQARAEIEATTEILKQWIPECVAASLEWREFLGEASPLYVLGRGPAMASVAEGVLLMHETAKAPAVGMSVAQFRHGPVEVVDRKFRAVVIGTQMLTEELDRALAADLQKMGGEVRWIGPASAASWGRWPAEVPQRFAAIAEIVPLQLAAYRKAELNGVRPGDFRWAPLITTSEAGFSLPDAQAK